MNSLEGRYLLWFTGVCQCNNMCHQSSI